MSSHMLETIRAKQKEAAHGIRTVWSKAASTYGPFYGLYRGKVINNVDPLELNRLLIDVPTLPCSIASFATPAAPYGGPQVGLVPSHRCGRLGQIRERRPVLPGLGWLLLDGGHQARAGRTSHPASVLLWILQRDGERHPRRGRDAP